MIEYLLGGIIAGVIGYFMANIYGVILVVLLYYIALCLVKLNDIEKKIDKIINIRDVQNND